MFVAILFAIAVHHTHPSHARPCGNSTLLDLGSVRRGLGIRDPSPLGQPPLPCDIVPNQVICSDTSFPNDILCDFEGLGSHPGWRGLGAVVNISISYRTPNGSQCQLLLRSSKDLVERYVFDSAMCFDYDGEVIPPFRVAGVRALYLKLHGGDCFEEKYIMTITPPESGVRTPLGVVKFEIDYYRCHKTPSFPHLIEGYVTVAKFAHDGRRFRPVTKITN